MKYDDQMDRQCIRLCDAINSISGLKTFESCCGHGKNSMLVFLEAHEVQDLCALAMSVNRMYGGPLWQGHEWTVKVWHIESGPRPTTCFLLESPSRGQVAYRHADKLAKNIMRNLRISRNIERQRSTKMPAMKYN